MHVMHVIDSLAVGGAERMLVEVANGTAADGHKVSVCVTRQATDLAAELHPDVRLWVLGRRRRFDWAAMHRFAALVRDERVDVLHAHSRSSIAFISTVKTISPIHPRIIFHDHSGGIHRDNSVPLWFRLWAGRWVNHYVGVCDRLGAWAEDAGLSSKSISVMDNALDLSRIERAAPLDVRREFGIAEDVPIGIVVGNLRRDKGQDVLLEAVSRSAHRRRMKILFVGGDRDKDFARECRARSAESDLDGAVTFLGERSDAPRLMQSADFAVLPSRSESGPLVLIEYMACGLPFVVSKVGGIADRAAELGAGEFVPPDDAAALTAALDRLLTLSPAERRERGEAGRRIALHHFDIRRAMPRWYEIYGAALEGAQA